MANEEKKQGRTPGNFEVISLDTKKMFLGLRPDGTPYTRYPEGPWDEPTRLTTNKRTTSQLYIPLTDAAKGYALPLGLTVVSGPTAIGKSTFVRALSRVMLARRVLAVEPADSGDELATKLATNDLFSSTDGALMALMSSAQGELARDGALRTLLVLDSLRAPVFETDGPAGERGMIMSFFTKLTRVSNSLASSGVTVIATVNPMQEDDLVVKAFLQRLRSALPCVITLSGATISSAEETYRGTVTGRPLRQEQSFVWTVPGQGRTIRRTRQTSPVIEFDVADSSIPPLTGPERQSISSLSKTQEG